MKKAMASEEVRFHIFVSEKEIMRKFNKVLESKGYVGYWDASGQMSYVLDGRQGVEPAVRRMEEICARFDDAETGPHSLGAKRIREVILRYLESKQLSLENQGSIYLYEILYILLRPGSSMSNLRKGVYQDVADRHHTTSDLVDRSIRYAKGRAGISGGNRHFIATCLQELRHHGLDPVPESPSPRLG